MISMAGVPISVDAGDDARWAALDALFGTCRDTVDAPVGSVELGQDPPAAPDEAPDVRFADVSMWFTPDGVVTRHDDGLVVRRDGLAIHAGGPDLGRDLPRAFRRSVQHVLIDALADVDRHALHAAAIARGDRALVVLGDTGAGKSSLAIGALRGGWSVLTDDIAWLLSTSAGLDVIGFPKPLHVPADMRAEVPDASAQIVGDARGRYVSAARLTADDQPRRVVGVVEIRHGQGDGTVAPLASGSHLVAMALASYPLQEHVARARRFFPLAARLGRLPAVTIAHAADPARRAERAVALLDEAWDRLDQ